MYDNMPEQDGLRILLTPSRGCAGRKKCFHKNGLFCQENRKLHQCLPVYVGLPHWSDTTFTISLSLNRRRMVCTKLLPFLP